MIPGPIIGKSGSTIQGMQTQSGARMTMQKDSESGAILVLGAWCMVLAPCSLLFALCSLLFANSQLANALP